ncbi:MAG: hypothetical protein IJY50_08445 [Clostridia bacterium]|nr:hypothetical protein [Clostridia bacterium]
MKKKILVVALVVCVLVLSIASATMAYFTDTHSVTNTFTVGDVDITLTEAAVMQDETNGNIVADPNADPVRVENGIDFGTAYGSLFPMQSICKDPTINNVGSEQAYIGAIITIANGEDKVAGADVTKLLTFTGDAAADLDELAVNVTDFLVGLIDSGVATVSYAKVDGTVKVYIVVKAAVAGNNAAGDIDLFQSVKIADKWDNAQMKNLSDLEITVDAYATQVAGMGNDPVAALNTAFEDIFPTNP